MSPMKISQATVIRGICHAAAWVPFLTAVADSVRGNWRVVGDGAAIALRSWTATSHVPLVGQPNALGVGLHDPGPLQYWLLAIPVHIDPVRGVLWGGALWCLAAASLAIEAAWSALGKAGGLLASGIILAMVAWSTQVATKPYWNPSFGLMFFLAALAACWAVLSGHRWWWPVGVVTASVAAQAHLMFAIAAALLTLLALIIGLVDAQREKKGYWWAAAGLGGGLACWAAPLVQEFTQRPGNLTSLIRGQAVAAHRGLTFALKSLAAATAPPPLWWPHQHVHAARVIFGRPAPFAVAVLAVVAVALFAAVLAFRSRPLARLAAVSLLTSGAALVTFSHIPPGTATQARLGYLMMIMVPAGLLDWLTAGLLFAVTARQVISWLQAAQARHAEARCAEAPGGRQRAARAGTRWAWHGAGAAAVLLIVLASVPGLIQPGPQFPGDARRAELVSAGARLIERQVPAQQMTVSVVAASRRDVRRVAVGLKWALTGAGYRMGLKGFPPPSGPIRKVTVFLRDSQVTRIRVGMLRPAVTGAAAAHRPWPCLGGDHCARPVLRPRIYPGGGPRSARLQLR